MEELFHDDMMAPRRDKAEHDRTIAEALAEREGVPADAKAEFDRTIAEAHAEFRCAKAKANDECKRVTG